MQKKRTKARAAKRPQRLARPQPPDDIDVQIGLRIRARRMALDLTQTELGVAVGRSWQQIHKYERGHDRIRAAMLARIAAALKATPGFFYGDNGALPSDPASALPPNDPMNDTMAFLARKDGRELVAAYLKITDQRTAGVVLSLVTSLADREQRD